MIKFKHLLCTAIVGTLLYACGSDSNSPVDNFDHEAQAIIDNDSLVAFLKNNYYNEVLDSVKPVTNNETSLFDDDKLVTKEVTENDINYKLYYYVNRVGTPDEDKGFPTVMDSVYAKYKGQRIVRKDSLSPDFDKNTTWFSLNQVIRGWTYSFVHFKGGNNVTNDGPINYENGGKGILFIPSGLGYRNTGSRDGSIRPNENLMFYFELWDIVVDTDDDQDGVASINEDPDGDGNPRNDDTDKDNVPNYLDTDDDGDGVLSKDEDKNGDGNPANDFSDPNKPNVPDYLNRDIF
ncbi:peptidylprolyl isomerase [Tenacibaculum discolor]|uniref:Peptidyl-prolyl cis-trans isomerase n=1 Tax=Tenacibaculum discolor TaxID=361581 RepID=A0A2G1BWU4_9FLAO|nr:FKBP-type peptidyl-prolyl cis-trans isomerase [Tenacibaculum discolor]MDP2540569.1 FKBP-type peptidyl-prolyl cis-trans isomerase [Tenacibaculum discolor]PHN98531.1 peptidylprolyl isomerase [Tenacibaculum discolor]PHN99744.1 peptidylprolyl isomerase [Rhodobacteraceae bacterium 4F10]